MPPRYQSTLLPFDVKIRNLADLLGQQGHRSHARIGGGSSIGGLGQQSLIQNPTPNAETTGAAKLLVLSAAGVSIASGGDHVPFDSIIAQHGFEGVVPPQDGYWVHPISGVYVLSYSHEWAVYRGGGTIRLQLDGANIAGGLIAEGASGQEAIGTVVYVAAAGQVGSIHVDHEAGSDQLCDATVRIGITDPTEATAEEVTPSGGYRISLSTASQLLLVNRKLVGESESNLGQVAHAVSEDVWYWIRARIDGGRIRARAWEDGASEPGTWELDVTDLAPLDAGYAGIATKGGYPTIQRPYDPQDVAEFEVSIDGGAVQSTDFGSDDIGTSPPTGWSVLLSTGTPDWTVVENTGLTSQRMARYLGNDTVAGQWIGWTAAGTGTDMEVLAKVRQGYFASSSNIVLCGVIE